MGKLYPRHEKLTRSPAETTGNRYEIEISISRKQKLNGLSAASLGLKTLNDNPYLTGLKIADFYLYLQKCIVLSYDDIIVQ